MKKKKKKAAKKLENRAPIRIVVLQRGWVVVGAYSQSGDDCLIRHGHVIRNWGTTKGLGEIATNGPTDNTLLDAIPETRFHALTVVLSLDCATEKWADKCAP